METNNEEKHRWDTSMCRCFFMMFRNTNFVAYLFSATNVVDRSIDGSTCFEFAFCLPCNVKYSVSFVVWFRGLSIDESNI